MALLEAQGLAVTFETASGPLAAVQQADFQVAAGECVAVVGESGSGKSQMLLACAA